MSVETSPDAPPALRTAGAPSTRARHVRARVPELLFQSVLIVLSIALGFAVTEWQDRRRDEALAHEALINFRHEISTNLETLERVQPKHVAMMKLLEAEAAAPRPGETAFTALLRSLQSVGGTAVPPLPDAAWETAVSTGALRLIGYDRASRISATYQVQRTTLVQSILRLEDRLNSAPDFEPASREAMLRVHQQLFNELQGQEVYLIGVYQETLKQLGDR